MNIFKPTFTDRATGKQKQSPTYHIRFRDHLNRRQRFVGVANYNESHSLWLKLQALVTSRRTGEPLAANVSRWLECISDDTRAKLVSMDLLDARTTYADTPLIVQLLGEFDSAGVLKNAGYLQELTANGATRKHISVTIDRCKRIIEKCGFIYWRDLTQPGATTMIRSLLAGMRDNGRADAKPGRGNGKISAKTLNYYVREIKGFCRWLESTGRAPAMALAALKGVDQGEGEKYRALKSDEMRWLLAVSAAGTPRAGLAGEERALLYRFAFETAIRPDQIRSLKVASFDLSSTPATVSSIARHVKRRRPHTQQLTASLATVLSDRFKTMMPTAAAFRVPSRIAEMLRYDLAACRAAWINEATTDEEREQRQRSDFLADVNRKGEKAVFYSTRHGHGTALADAGVPEKNIGASMHHAPGSGSTKRYLHTDDESVASAIKAIPDLTPIVLASTGTEDKPMMRLSNACPTASTSVESGGVRRRKGTITHPGVALENISTSGDSGGNPRKGLLAELADAVDSKSTGDTAKTPINQVSDEKLGGCLSIACPTPIPSDPELAAITSAWPSLPADTRSVILRLVKG